MGNRTERRSCSSRFAAGLSRMPLAALLSLAMLAPAVCGQSPSEPKTPPREQTLTQRQATLQKGIAAFEQRMQRLAKLLAEDEPEKAEKLRDALAQSRERRIDRKLRELVTLLKSLQFSDAEKQQEVVLSDLEQILTILTETLGDLDLKRQRRERLAAMRRRIRTLIQEQSENLFRTRGLQSDAERAEELEKIASELEKIEESQSELREGAQDQQGQDAQRRERQQELEDRTRQAADKLKKMSEAEQDRPAESGAAQQAEKAAEAMQQAGRQMEGGQEQEARQSQEEAEEKLRRAIRRLREERDRLEDEQRAREIEEKQRELERKAGELENEMRKGARDSDRVPGRKNIGKAREQMQRAADRMGEKSPEQSERSQEAAVDELQQALDRLEEALRQMRNEELEETLAALEVRFKRMLASEEEIQASVQELNEKDAGQWRRVEQMRLAESGKLQNEVAQSCRTVQRIIVQEGTTVIFPEIVSQLAEDMEEIAKLLDVGDLSCDTQALLAGVIDILREIVAAIETNRDNMQNRNQNQQQQQQQQGDQQQPLLPDSAELKLLRSRQIGLNRRTAALGDENNPLTDEKKTALFDRLTARQRLLSDLTRKMNERK